MVEVPEYLFFKEGDISVVVCARSDLQTVFYRFDSGELNTKAATFYFI
jgi:hypothetical protein